MAWRIPGSYTKEHSYSEKFIGGLLALSPIFTALLLELDVFQRACMSQKTDMPFTYDLSLKKYLLYNARGSMVVGHRNKTLAVIYLAKI